MHQVGLPIAPGPSQEAKGGATDATLPPVAAQRQRNPPRKDASWIINAIFGKVAVKGDEDGPAEACRLPPTPALLPEAGYLPETAYLGGPAEACRAPSI